MNNLVIGALTAIISTLIGFSTSFLLELWKNKKEKERVTLELKINTYADAIRYISICAKITTNKSLPNNVDYVKDLMSIESELYNRFHPIFTIIAPPGKIEAYNELKNRVFTEKISQEKAYELVVNLLDFNINK